MVNGYMIRDYWIALDESIINRNPFYQIKGKPCPYMGICPLYAKLRKIKAENEIDIYDPELSDAERAMIERSLKDVAKRLEACRYRWGTCLKYWSIKGRMEGRT